MLLIMFQVPSLLNERLFALSIEYSGKIAARYRGAGREPPLTRRIERSNRRQRPPTLEEAIAAQDARRAAAEMENYHSDMDDSYRY